MSHMLYMREDEQRFGVPARRSSKTHRVHEPRGEHADRDEYFVRRLEAFGDIVIGFSLAMLALSLIVPNHARTLLTNSTWFVAYAWTFAFVCSMWGSHYWTFRYVFIPTRLSVLLNYAKLGLIVLLMYMVQVLLRAFEHGTARDVIVANELYWGCLAAYWVTAALLLVIGMRVRGSTLAPAIAKSCTLRIWRIAATTPMILAGLAVGARGAATNVASTVALFLAVGVVIGVFAGRLATLRFT
jgi:uncharacterized membrane protein